METKKPEDRVVLGTLGALIGSMLGVVYLVMQGQSRWKVSLACLGGVVLAVCTLQGYAMLGRRLSKRGAVISLDSCRGVAQSYDELAAA